MVTYKHYLTAFTLTIVAACQNIPPALDVKNSQIKDRVIACSGGFSQDAQIALQGLVDLANNPLATGKGELSLDYKQQAQSIVFKELDPKDRLQAYQDYIKCIESNWNTPVQVVTSRSRIKVHKDMKCHHGQSDKTEQRIMK